MDSDSAVASLNLNLKAILGSFKVGWGQVEYIHTTMAQFVCYKSVMGLEKDFSRSRTCLAYQQVCLVWIFKSGNKNDILIRS